MSLLLLLRSRRSTPAPPPEDVGVIALLGVVSGDLVLRGVAQPAIALTGRALVELQLVGTREEA